jgi:hypothetical protein
MASMPLKNERRGLAAFLWEEAEREFQSRPKVDQAALLDEIRRHNTFCPAAVGAPDSTALLREDRER